MKACSAAGSVKLPHTEDTQLCLNLLALAYSLNLISSQMQFLHELCHLALFYNHMQGSGCDLKLL